MRNGSSPSRPVIRAYSPDDFGTLLGIEWGLPSALREEPFRALLHGPDTGCVVFVLERTVVGFLIYRWTRLSYEIVRVAVRGDYRRRRVARAGVRWLEKSARSSGRTVVEIRVKERAVDLQCFFRSCGYFGTIHRSGMYVFRKGL